MPTDQPAGGAPAAGNDVNREPQDVLTASAAEHSSKAAAQLVVSHEAAEAGQLPHEPEQHDLSGQLDAPASHAAPPAAIAPSHLARLQAAQPQVGSANPPCARPPATFRPECEYKVLRHVKSQSSLSRTNLHQRANGQCRHT